MDRFQDLETFIRVVETGGFTNAASELGLSKSVVSRRINDLENRLGARLLNRTTRRLSPTEVGQAFYERCKRILADVEEAEAAVTNLQTAPRGTLRISAPTSLGRIHLAPILGEFMRTYPDISLDVSLNDRFVDLVDEGYDLAIRVGHLRDSSLIAARLASARRIAIASPAYLAARGEPQTLAELSTHECIVYTATDGGDVWRLNGADGPRTIRISGRVHTNDGEVMCRLAMAGHGIAVVPTFVCDELLRTGQLKVILSAVLEDEVGIYAVYPHSRHLSPKVRALVDFLKLSIGPKPAWEKVLDDCPD